MNQRPNLGWFQWANPYRQNVSWRRRRSTKERRLTGPLEVREKISRRPVRLVPLGIRLEHYFERVVPPLFKDVITFGYL